LLALPTAAAVADDLLAEPMPIPAFYAHIGPANTLGVPPAPGPDLPEITVADLTDEVHVLDIRPQAAQAAGFLPGSIGIELADDFGSWAGWLLPYGEPIALVAEPGQDLAEARTQLTRIGLDDVRGVIGDLGTAATSRFELAELPTFVNRLPGAQVLDVRMPSEHRAAPLPGAIERFLPDLLTDGIPAELDPDRPVLVACGSGRRAAIAATLLTRHGYEPVVLTGAGAPQAAAALAA
ncbi:MAG: MBL fold metallo-hydrolase, partial [Catenulispora sp.]|nr:MBL fold metallo-hydrolase [Catenulispora sp.]